MAHLFIHSVKYLYKAPSKKTAQMLSQLQHKDENIGEEVLEWGKAQEAGHFGSRGSQMRKHGSV